MRCTSLAIALGLAACSGEPAPVASTPLRAAVGGDGPRFAKLTPAQTGLAFVNELRPAHIVPYLYNGAGVAVGDYDDDGLPDVYLVSQDGANKLFRQVAPLQFEDVTEAAGGLGGGAAWGTAASFADVDGDGDLDLYVCNTEAPNLLYQNDGDGSFTECAGKFGLAFCGASTGASFADYDNDGDLDLYVLTNRVLGPTLPPELVADIVPPADTRARLADMAPPNPAIELKDGVAIIPPSHTNLLFAMQDQVFAGGQPDHLFRNDGYAKFTDVTAQSGIAGHGMGLSATWWDTDDDGWLDLYVANDLESPDVLWRNRGDGTFENITERALPHTAYFGMGADFGDIDNDGRLDFCVADMSSTTHYMGKMLMGNMGDRRWFLENARPGQYMRNAVYLNTGTERFMEVAFLTGLASTDWTWTVRFADLDDDGRVDLFATNGIPRFDNDPDAAAEFKRLWRLDQRAEALALARNLPPVYEKNFALRNTGDLKFENIGRAWGLDEASVGQGAAVVDLDRDGDLDVVVNNLNAEAGVFENRGIGSRRALVRLVGRRDNRHGIGARVTIEAGGTAQTTIVTLARGYMSAGEPLVHFGLGDAARIDRLVVRWPSGVEQVCAELPADRLHVITEPDAAPSPREPPPTAPWFADATAQTGLEFRHVEAPFDDYSVQPLLPAKLSRLGPGIAWGDADEDGRDDVFVGGAAGQSGALFLARASSRFERVDGPWAADAAAEDMGVLWLDADQDDDLDLFVVSGGVEHATEPELLRDRLYLNLGNARFERAPASVLPDDDVAGSCAAAADFDRDGDLDLFVGGRVIAGRFPKAPPSRLLRNVGGRFVDATDEVAPVLRDAGLVTSALWSDYDDDGFVDLLVAAHYAPIRVLHNDAGERLVDRTEACGLGGHLGLWNGLAGADLDRDGDIDYVATNLGLNTKYKAAPDHPLEIFAADFDDDHVLDVVEAKHQGDLLLPVRGRSCSSAAMPFLAEKFHTFDAFARASLGEIYTDAALSRALRRSATTLAHALLVNRGDRTFELRSLPREAQAAPGFGVGAADFDGDGWVDLAIAQNSFAPEPETGRHDGGTGIVLAGRGDLAFGPLRASVSGFIAPEDGKGLGIADVDGDRRPDLTIAASDGPLRVLRCIRGPARTALRLVGPRGNPSAVGARITVARSGGKRDTIEIHAGSGYLSQCAPAAFVTDLGARAEIDVRWPDGSTQHRIVEGPVATLVLTANR